MAGVLAASFDGSPEEVRRDDYRRISQKVTYWPGPGNRAFPAAHAAVHDRIVYVDRKGVTQTMVVEVLPAIPRDHPDYPALLLANNILGGMSDNRIWENIRQQHGIAYYADSDLSTFPGSGIWTIQSPVQQDSTALAMREFEKELAAFGRARPITQAELDQAKIGFIRSVPEDFETVSAAAGTIAWNWAQGLPLSQLQSFSERLAAVTLDQANAFARKYARPEKASSSWSATAKNSSPNPAISDSPRHRGWGGQSQFR